MVPHALPLPRTWLASSVGSMAFYHSLGYLTAWGGPLTVVDVLGDCGLDVEELFSTPNKLTTLWEVEMPGAGAGLVLELGVGGRRRRELDWAGCGSAWEELGGRLGDGV